MPKKVIRNRTGKKKIYYRKNTLLKKPIEAKYNSIHPAAQAIVENGAFTLLNGIAQGDDNTNREGRKIHMKSLLFKYILYNTTADAVPKKARVMILLDKATNGADPAVGQLLGPTEVGYNTIAPRDPDFMERFRVLYDKTFIDMGANASMGQQIHIQQKYIKLEELVQYIGTDATVASIGKNSLYVLVLGDPTTHSIIMNSVMKYYDV